MADDSISAGVCACLRAGEPFTGRQGFTYAPAISAETVGAGPRAARCGASARAHRIVNLVSESIDGLTFGPDQRMSRSTRPLSE